MRSDRCYPSSEPCSLPNHTDESGHLKWLTHRCEWINSIWSQIRPCAGCFGFSQSVSSSLFLFFGLKELSCLNCLLLFVSDPFPDHNSTDSLQKNTLWNLLAFNTLACGDKPMYSITTYTLKSVLCSLPNPQPGNIIYMASLSRASCCCTWVY